LDESLIIRQELIKKLNRDLVRESDEAMKQSIQADIDTLQAEIVQVEAEIDLVVLGLQARQFKKESAEPEPVDIKTEIAQVFEPIVLSLERATEPARRMEELRQLAEQTEGRIAIAQATLDSIAVFQNAETEYPEALKLRLNRYNAVWQSRLQEAQNLGVALDEQLEVARRAQGNSFKQFTQDFGSFIFNRGASLLLALGMGIGFILLCQAIRLAIANFFRRRRGGVLSAALRIFSMAISLIGVVGGFVIAMTIFNIRHDWLMLAMSLLLALAVTWTFIRSLPVLLEQVRVLLNLGAVREGERTLVNGLPYRIDRLSWYSQLSNPDLKGGTLVYPVRELLGMHSRPVTPGEAWFPTRIGDWIVRNGRHFEVIDQTPEHVIIRRPGGSEDFIPVQEFLGTEFEVLTDGYRAKYEFGLDYKHLKDAVEKIPKKIEDAVKEKITSEFGDDSITNAEVRFIGLGESDLKFDVLADMAPGLGEHWRRMQVHLNKAVVEACVKNKWSIPYPQLVVHQNKVN
jgi:uncharacterized membrane protein